MTARYSIIPADAVGDERLTPADLRVLCALGAHLGKTNEAWPSQGRIAEKARVDRKTANRALQKLIEIGYVIARPRRSGPMKTTLLYRVVMDPDLRVDDGSQQAELFAEEEFGEANSSITADEAIFLTPSKTAATADEAKFPIDGENCPIDEAPGCPNKNVPNSSVTNVTAFSAEKASEEAEAESQPTVSEHPAQLQKRIIFGAGAALLASQGLGEAQARSFLGGLIKASSVAIVAQAVSAATMDPPVEAKGWLTRAVARRAGRSAPTSDQRAEHDRSRVADLDRRMAKIAAGGTWQHNWGQDPRIGDEGVPAELYEKHGIPRPPPPKRRSA